MQDDLLIAIGADLSSFNAALKTAEEKFNTASNRISRSNPLQFRMDTSRIAGEIKKTSDLIKNKMRTLKTQIAFDLGIDTNTKEGMREVEMLAKKTMSKIATIEKENEQLKRKEIQETDAYLNKIIDALQRRQLANLKRRNRKEKESIKALEDEEDKRIAENTARLKKAIDSREQYKRKKAKQSLEWQKTAEMSAARDLLNRQRMLEQNKNRMDFVAQKRQAEYERRRADLLFKRELRIIHRREQVEKKAAKSAAEARLKLAKAVMRKRNELSRKEFNNEMRRIRQLSDAEVKRVQRRAVKSTSKTGNWDFSGHRDLINSALVVAKYGAISTALYGVSNAIKSIATEIIHANDSIYQNMAVLNKSRRESIYLMKATQQIGVEYGGEIQDIQEAMITLGRAGVDETKTLAEATKVLKELALITGDDMRDGAEAMSSLINVYDIGADKIRNLGEQMAYVTNATRLGVKDLSTISNYALVAAKNIGLTQDAYFALNGVLSKAGMNASTIGTNIRRLNKIMFDDSKQNLEMFRVLGYRQKEFADAMQKDSIKALSEFINQLRSVDTSRYNNAVAGMDTLTKQLLDGLKGGGKFFDDFIEKFKEMEKHGGSLQTQAEQMSKGFTISFQKIWNSIKTASSEMATFQINFSGYAKTIGDAIDFMIKKLSELKKMLTDLIPLLGGVFDALGDAFGGGQIANMSKNANKNIEQLTADITALEDANSRSVGGIFGLSEEEYELNEKRIAQKSALISKIYDEEYATGKVALKVKDLAKAKKDLATVEKGISKNVRPILAAETTAKTLEYQRKEKVYQQQLNGTYKKSVFLNTELTSLLEKRARLEKEYANKQSAANQEALAKVNMQISEKQLAIVKAVNNENEKAAHASDRASKAGERNAKAADRTAVAASRLAIIQAKQLKAEAKLAALRGHKGLSKAAALKLELNVQRQIVKEAAKAYRITLYNVKGEKSLRASKIALLNLTNEQVKAQRLANEYAMRYSDIFDDLAHGDIIGAFEGIGKALQDAFKIQDIGSAWSGLMSSLVEGTKIAAADINAVLMSTGWYALIMVGTRILGKLLNSHVSDAAMKQAKGITTVVDDTVKNSITRIEKNSTTGLKYSEQMVHSLKQIVDLTQQAGANVGSKLLGEDYNPMNTDGIWGGKSYELVASGIKINPASIQEINAGQMSASEYMTEKITKSSWFGLSNKESLRTTDLGEASDDVMAPINEAYEKMIDSIKTAAETLGVSAQEFDEATANWVSSINQLNFAGKSAAEAGEMIAGVIGKDSGTLAATLSTLVPYMQEYKLAGEQQGETLIRLANDYEVVGRSMSHLGMILPIVAQGGIAVAEALIQGAGGMDKYRSAMSIFMNTFFTDAERYAFAQQDLAKSFAAVGMTLPATKEAMKATIISIQQQVAAQAVQLEAAKQKLKAEMQIAGITSQAAIVAGSAAAAAAQKVKEAQQVLDELNVKYEMIMSHMEEIGNVFGDASAAIGGTCGAMANLSESAVDVTTEIEILYASLTDIARLSAEWMESLEGAELVLEAVRKETGLVGVTYENFLEKFKAASQGALTQDELNKWQSLSSALKAVRAAEDEIMQKRLEAVKKELDFYNDILDRIEKAYTGNLSYLTSVEKAQYLDNYAQQQLAVDDTKGYLDTLAQQLEYEKKMSLTKEDYIPKFDEYINELKNTKPEKTTDDVVETLETIYVKISDIEDAIEKASYQG